MLIDVQSTGRYQLAYSSTPRDAEDVDKCIREEFATVKARLVDACKRPGRIASGAPSTEVEYKNTGSGKAVVASVNGVENATFIVAGRHWLSKVTPKYAHRVGLVIEHPLRTEMDIGFDGKWTRVPIVRAPSFMLGDAIVENMEIGVLDHPDPDVDGVIAFDFLRRFRVSFDKEQNHFTLATLPAGK